MPYSKEHKKLTREKIIRSAIKLFSANGFEQVSINELMQDAELTRGAFYSHFKNKQTVYSEAMISAARHSQITKTKSPGTSDTQWIKEFLNDYLSINHINQKISPCPLAFLVNDISNDRVEIQQTYTHIFKGISNKMHSYFSEIEKRGEDKGLNKQDILSAIAMMIGGVAIARALSDDELIYELLESCRNKVETILNLSS